VERQPDSDTSVTWVARHWSAVIGRACPGRTILKSGETGWATRRNDQGDQRAGYMKGVLGEAEQGALSRRPSARWVRPRRAVPTVVFEAFDENCEGWAPMPRNVE
jgi:hypothetical protein